MAMKEFVVTRYAVRPDGTMTVPVSTHEEKTPALKDYLQKCATACDSDYMTDAVVLTTYQGFVLRSEFFDHRDRIQPIQPEPEPNEE